MKFCKMNGIGNDYIFIYLPNNDIKRYPLDELAKKLSDRHYCIGGDGIVLINKIDIDTHSMRIFNADGSEAEMCGNAIRCVAKYLFDNKLVKNAENIRISTLCGIKTVDLVVIDGDVKTATVNMGKPIITPCLIPVAIDTRFVVNYPLCFDEDKVVNITCVSMGNPHAIIIVDSLDDKDINMGASISNHPIFPKRTNVEFVKVDDRKNITMRVYERGSGETLACGTGACAAMYACYAQGLVDNNITVHLLGGELQIYYNNIDIYMTGKANLNFQGEIHL